MQLYNSLSKKIETFVPLKKDGPVGVYACGPTVYWYPQIGNWRSFVTCDLLVRTLTYFGYDVHFVMNITDVGHLTGDNLGDADTGEDRLEKGAKREGKTAWDVAKYYSDDFTQGFDKLNLIKPTLEDGKEGYCVATDHIKEQIEMVRAIEKKGYAYTISDGVYFDVQAFEKDGNEYGLMSNIHKDNVEGRLAENQEKRDNRDFALWKFSKQLNAECRMQNVGYEERGVDRQMEWWFDGPLAGEILTKENWEKEMGRILTSSTRTRGSRTDISAFDTVGFPGWHIECSAMSVKYLGEQFDIHLGGEDHKSTHHPNEIVQAEVATGKRPFVKYWMHTAFLQVDGGRMGKSLGNAYTLQGVVAKGYKPEHLRYFYLGGHYRQPLNFTWTSLDAAKIAYEKLVARMKEMDRIVKNQQSEADSQNEEMKKVVLAYERRFQDVLGDDLNMPKVLALLWEVVKSEELNPEGKLFLILNWDDVLGLKLSDKLEVKSHTYLNEKNKLVIESDLDLKLNVIELIEERETARREKDWAKSDEIRVQLAEMGFSLVDREGKVRVSKS